MNPWHRPADPCEAVLASPGSIELDVLPVGGGVAGPERRPPARCPSGSRELLHDQIPAAARPGGRDLVAAT